LTDSVETHFMTKSWSSVLWCRVVMW